MGVDYEGEYRVDWTHHLGEVEQPIIHSAFGYAAQLVVMDPETQAIDEVVAVHDVGQAVNPMLCEGQIEGSVHMGLGYALTEDFPSDEASFPTNMTLRSLGILRAQGRAADPRRARRVPPAPLALRHQGRRRDRPGPDRTGGRRRAARRGRGVAVEAADEAEALRGRRGLTWAQ